MSAPGAPRARRSVITIALTLTALAVVGGPQASATSDRAAAYGCTRTVADEPAGPQTVGAGEKLCLLSGAQVDGIVTVNPGGALLSQGATIVGAVNVTGAASFILCNSTITGAITVAGSPGATSLGDNHLCAGSDIDGAVTLNDNRGALRLAGNTVTGAVTVTGNSTGASTGPRVAGNVIGGDLSCSANAPRPTNTGRVNTVSGTRSGQCIAAAF